MGGDSEFIIMSYAADKVVLRGKKTQNTIVLTPLPETAWNTMFGKYSADVNKMDNFRSYELVLNGKTYDISREVGAMMENIGAISLTKGITFDVKGTPGDTTLVCVVTPKDPAVPIDRETLSRWLKIRTKVENVKLFVEP